MKGLLALSLGAVALGTHPTAGQIQTTLGPCSSAIARITGNVSVTCITTDRRIRIARFTGAIDPDRGKRFTKFVSNNLGKVVYIKTYTDMDSGLYTDFLSVDDFCPDGSVCGKTNVFFNDFHQKSTAFPYHGSWAFQGYYLVSGGGYAMGSVEYALKPIDEKEIVMSPKYQTE